MNSSMDFGRQILIRRMVAAIERAGYRVEFAEEYNGYIVAGQGEDPSVMLLEADTIEGLRLGSPGNPNAFVEAVVEHVRKNINVKGSASIGPPVPAAAGGEHEDVPAGPPDNVDVDENMIVAEEAAGQPPPRPERKLEEEVTEELSLDDFKNG